MCLSNTFVSQAIREISRIITEFNFANMQDLFISQELNFATLGFSLQKIAGKVSYIKPVLC